MSRKIIKLIWSENKFIQIVLYNNPVADYYYNCIKKLKNINLSFGPRENPLDPFSLRDSKKSIQQLTQKIMHISSQLGITVQPEKLLVQDYLNELHEIYFTCYNKRNTDNNSIWLDFHDIVHLIEDINQGKNNRRLPTFWFDYKHFAGPLIHKFDRTLLKYAVTECKKGMCFISERELGKNLYKYYKDGEPNDINSINRICKPWVYLKPVMDIAYEDYSDSLNYSKDLKFIEWLNLYKDGWCSHWGITDWDPSEMFAKIPIGSVIEIDLLQEYFSCLDYPSRIVPVN